MIGDLLWTVQDWRDRLLDTWSKLGAPWQAAILAVPTWTLAGVLMVFGSLDGGGGAAAALARHVAAPAAGTTATFRAHDGGMVLYARGTDGSWQEVRRLDPETVPGQFAKLAATSPDRRMVAYVRAEDQFLSNATIAVVEVATGDETPLVTIPQGLFPATPVWSPDGSRLAIVRRGGENLELWTVGVAGGDLTRVPTDGGVPPTAFYGSNLTPLVWSEDSDRLSYTVPDSDGEVAVRTEIELATGAVRVSEAVPQEPASPCEVPVFSQNDPRWADERMATLGDTIGTAGCALTATAMLLNYFGNDRTPAELNACLGGAAEPIYWAAAADQECDEGEAAFESYDLFSWDRLAQLMAQGRPVILGFAGGITGSHYVVVTSGYGSDGGNYSIVDPWDGSTWKTIDSYAATGYVPSWLVVYRGPAPECDREIAPPVQVPDPMTAATPMGVDGTWRWLAAIRQIAEEEGVDPVVLQAVMALASGGDPSAVGPEDPEHGRAMGLMQVWSRADAEAWRTAAGNLNRFPTDAEMLDPALNLRAGAAKLAWLHARGGNWTDWLVAAVGYFGAATPDGQLTGGRDAQGTDGWTYYDRLRANVEAIRAVLGDVREVPPPPIDSHRPSTWPEAYGIDTIFGGQPYTISQNFGPTDFVLGPGAYDYSADYGLKAGDHAGTDLAVPMRTGLFSPVAAKVIYAGEWRYFAPKNVQLELADGTVVIFGHMSEVYVSVGMTVAPTQPLGLSGTAGTGPHLHLEVRVPDLTLPSSKRVVDPMVFFGTGGRVGGGPGYNWPTAEAIDARIEQSWSGWNSHNPNPLRGKGEAFLRFGAQYGINPGVVTAVLQRESQLGTDGYPLATQANNFGGITGSGNCGSIWVADRYFAKFCTVDDGIEANFAIFNLSVYRQSDGTMGRIMEIYAPPWDGNNHAEMWGTFSAVATSLNITLTPSTNIYTGYTGPAYGPGPSPALPTFPPQETIGPPPTAAPRPILTPPPTAPVTRTPTATASLDGTPVATPEPTTPSTASETPTTPDPGTPAVVATNHSASEDDPRPAAPLPDIRIRGPQDWHAYAGPVTFEGVNVISPDDRTAVVSSSVPPGTTFTQDGRYTITTTVVSPLLPGGFYQLTTTFFVDATAPITQVEVQGIRYDGSSDTLATKTEPTVYHREAVVSLVPADELTPIASVMYRVDGGEWRSYTNNALAHPLSFRRHGCRTVEFYAIDAAGNAEAAQRLSVCVFAEEPEPLEVPTPTPTDIPGRSPTTNQGTDSTPAPLPVASPPTAIVALTPTPSIEATATAAGPATAPPVEASPIASPEGSPAATAEATPDVETTEATSAAASPEASPAVATPEASPVAARPEATPDDQASPDAPLPAASPLVTGDATPAVVSPEATPLASEAATAAATMEASIDASPIATPVEESPAATEAAAATPSEGPAVPEQPSTPRPTEPPATGTLRIKTVGTDEEVLTGACYRATVPDGVPMDPTCDGADGADDGVTTIEGVRAGRVSVEQTTEPSAHQRAEPRNIEVPPDRETEIAVESPPLPGVLVIETRYVPPPDADSPPVPIGGACFLFVAATGEQIGPVCDNEEFDADDSELIRLEQVPAGQGTLRQISAPVIYKLAEDVPVTVEPGSETSVAVANDYLRGDVTIVVVDTGGAPVAGACFTLTTSLERISVCDGDAWDANKEEVGTIVLTAIEVGEGEVRVVQETTPEGYQAITELEPFTILSDQPNPPITVEHERLEEVVVVKVDRYTGEPLPGAEFALLREGAEVGGRAATGDDGKARFVVPPGAYVVREVVSPPDYQQPEDVTIVVEANDAEPVPEVEIPGDRQPVDLVVWVHGPDRGAVLTDACFELIDGGFGVLDEPLARCDGDDGRSDGETRFDGIYPAPYLLSETEPPAEYMTAAVRPIDLTAVTDGSTESVDHTPYGRVSVTTRLPDGTPVGPACYDLYEDRGDGSPGEEVIATGCGDAAGSPLDLEPEVQPGDYVLVQASIDAVYAGAGPRPVPVEPGKNSIDVEVTIVPMTGGLSVEITYADGSPLAGNKICLALVDPTGQVENLTRCGTNGTISFDGVPAGTYRVQQISNWPAELATQPTIDQEVTIEPGLTTDIEHRVGAESFTVTARLTGPDGAPIAGATILVEQSAAIKGACITDQDGRCEIGLLVSDFGAGATTEAFVRVGKVPTGWHHPPDTYPLTITAGGTQAVDFVAGPESGMAAPPTPGTDVEQPTPRTDGAQATPGAAADPTLGTLVIRVRDADGNPVAGWAYEVVTEHDVVVSSGGTEDNGEARIPIVDPDEEHCVAHDDEGQPDWITIELSPDCSRVGIGATVEVEVTARQATGRLVVRVDGGGVPATGLSFTISNHKEKSWLTVPTEEDGVYEVSGLPSGYPYCVSIAPDSDLSGWQEVLPVIDPPCAQVPPDGDAIVEFRATPATTPTPEQQDQAPADPTPPAQEPPTPSSQDPAPPEPTPVPGNAPEGAEEPVT